MEAILQTDGLVAKTSFAAGAAVFVAFANYLFTYIKTARALSRFPLVNEKWDAEAKRTFAQSASEILAKGVALTKGGPFRINARSSEQLILSPKYVDEVKNDERLDFHGFVAKQFFSSYPGFDAFSASVNQTVFQDAVRTQLTQALALTVAPIAQETPNTLCLVYGAAPDWKETILTPSLLKSVARISSLIFLGESFMNNPEWQHISVMYTVDAFMAATALNTWPAALRPIVHWFLPECRKIRAEVKTAKKLIVPEVERRMKEMAANGGKPRRRVLDSVDWFAASAKGQDFDYANAELSLAMAAIHTTTNTLGFAMQDLLENPEYIPLLRAELREVYDAQGGWEKATLQKLRLMDSVLKESMRCHPHSLVNMPRQATTNITLSDNTYIPTGTILSIGPTPGHDPKIFPDPLKFDGHRFVRMRDAPGAETKHQFVTTTPDLLVFGHGHHACPGRFFASNELKLLLAHMLMYYDWKLPDGQTKIEGVKNGTGRSPNSRQKVLFKSRTPEIPL